MGPRHERPSRDADLRRIVRQRLIAEHPAGSDTLILDEFAVCRGQARIDIAVVNGVIGGYELKSEADHLRRVPSQVRHYSRVFDTVTMVVAPKHASEAIRLVPAWYGLWIAEPNALSEITEVRQAGVNPDRCMRSICQLLWREEMLALLASLGAERGMHSRPRRDLITAICQLLELDVIASRVRKLLLDRHAVLTNP